MTNPKHTDTSSSGDLVERLRGDWPEILVEKHWMMDSDAIDKQREEAADRIEELEAWKAAEEVHHHMLRQELDRCRASNAVMDNTVASLTAKVERLWVIEADRAELVAEIVAWLNVRAGQVLQLHAEAKTDHERNIVDEHSSAIEQCAIEIEAKWG